MRRRIHACILLLNLLPKLSTNQPLSHTHMHLSHTRTPVFLSHAQLSHTPCIRRRMHACILLLISHACILSHVKKKKENVYGTREEETYGMIELACRLKIICSKYKCQDGAPLWLDVGMDSGHVILVLINTVLIIYYLLTRSSGLTQAWTRDM
jgi:hypothetical protein